MTKSRASTVCDDNFVEPQKRGRKSAAGRKLMRWDPSHDQLVLLYIEYLSIKKNIPIPWNEVASHLNDFTTGEGIKQHLAKVRIAREIHGQPVPPKIGGRKRVETAVTEGEHKKRADGCKRSGLLFYPDGKSSKPTPSHETQDITRRSLSSTKATSKSSKTSNVVDGRMSLSYIASNQKTRDHTKEPGHTKKRNRGSALEKELQELVGVDEYPAKKQMTSKLRIREPVDYSEMEIQENDHVEEKYDKAPLEQQDASFGYVLQDIPMDHQAQRKTGTTASFNYSGQAKYTDHSNGGHGDPSKIDPMVSSLTSTLPQMSPFVGTQPHSGYHHISASSLSKYDTAPMSHFPPSRGAPHVRTNTFLQSGLNTDVGSFRHSDSPAPSLQTESVLNYSNPTTLVNEKFVDTGFLPVHGNGLDRQYSGQATMRMPASQDVSPPSPQPLSLIARAAQPTSAPVFSEHVSEQGPMISGWSDESSETMLKTRFPTLQPPRTSSPYMTVNPFDVHVDPYQASSSYAHIATQHENGIVPLKGEAPASTLGPATITVPAYKPSNSDHGRYRVHMQKVENLKARVANHEDTFDADIAPSKSLPPSDCYRKEDWELLGVKIKDIHPIEKENVRDPSATSEHDDDAVPLNEYPDPSGIEGNENMYDDDATFNQFINM